MEVVQKAVGVSCQDLDNFPAAVARVGGRKFEIVPAWLSGQAGNQFEAVIDDLRPTEDPADWELHVLYNGKMYPLDDALKLPVENSQHLEKVPERKAATKRTRAGRQQRGAKLESEEAEGEEEEEANDDGNNNTDCSDGSGSSGSECVDGGSRSSEESIEDNSFVVSDDHSTSDDDRSSSKVGQRHVKERTKRGAKNKEARMGPEMVSKLQAQQAAKEAQQAAKEARKAQRQAKLDAQEAAAAAKAVKAVGVKRKAVGDPTKKKAAKKKA